MKHIDEEIKLDDKQAEISTIQRLDSPKIDMSNGPSEEKLDIVECKEGPAEERFAILESERKEAGTVNTI